MKFTLHHSESFKIFGPSRQVYFDAAKEAPKVAELKEGETPQQPSIDLNVQNITQGAKQIRDRVSTLAAKGDKSVHPGIDACMDKINNAESTVRGHEEDKASIKAETVAKLKEKNSPDTKWSMEENNKRKLAQQLVIEKWATGMGFVRGEDYSMEDLADTTKLNDFEKKEFIMLIKEDKYEEFKKYFLGEYSKEMKKMNPESNIQLGYSWGGRFIVYSDRGAHVPFDTVASNDVKNGVALTHHNKFKEFFSERTKKEFPSAEELNKVLKEMADVAIPAYEAVDGKLQQLKNDKTTKPELLAGLWGTDVGFELELLRNAKSKYAVKEIPEEGRRNDRDPEQDKIRRYADLTYNIESVGEETDRIIKLTGVKIPESARVDKIYEQHFGYLPGEMKGLMKKLCDDFPAYLSAEKSRDKKR